MTPIIALIAITMATSSLALLVWAAFDAWADWPGLSHDDRLSAIVLLGLFAIISGLSIALLAALTRCLL